MGVWDNQKKKYVLSLQETDVVNTFVGNGSDVAFSLAFTIIDKDFNTVNLPDPTSVSQIEIFTIASGANALVPNIDYTYNASTGVVTFTNAPASQDTITVYLRDFADGFKTLCYDEEINGWSSFFTYKPIFGGSLDADFYTYSESNDLYKHYDLTANRNSFYGNASNASTVEVIMNQPPSINKYFKTINYEGSTGWEITSMLTDSDTAKPIDAYVTTSAAAENTWQDLIVSGFKKKNNKYYSSIMNQSLPGRNEIIYGEDISGIKGFFNKLTLSISDTTQKELFSVSSEYELLTN
jgi:hypothetical protein